MRSGDRTGPGRRASARARAGGPPRRILPGVGWFPADEFETALARWPQLAGLWEIRDYAAYCRMLDAAMVSHSRGTAPWLMPIHPDRLVTWAESRGPDPGGEEARAGCAADQARLAARRDRHLLVRVREAVPRLLRDRQRHRIPPPRLTVPPSPPRRGSWPIRVATPPERGPARAADLARHRPPAYRSRSWVGTGRTTGSRPARQPRPRGRSDR